ncbi:Panacea domain-containing protein [Terasakiella sp.]|uniref:Panacea domain-containing protein n=1 Tax=Terasakiella sp. TaxID=2034861 RepID=UPI003AA990FE
MAAAVETMYDVAAWFMDHALNDNEYLQPMKMHRLLFLSQSYFAIAYHGRKLAPGVFVADDMGPIEPHVFRAFEQGRPSFYLNTNLPAHIETFLESIWRRFGSYSADKLSDITKKTPAYQKAIKKGRRTEIEFKIMVASFSKHKEAPSIDKVLKPRVLRSQTGRPVQVKSWAPGLRKVAEATPLPSQKKVKK